MKNVNIIWSENSNVGTMLESVHRRKNNIKMELRPQDMNLRPGCNRIRI